MAAFLELHLELWRRDLLEAAAFEDASQLADLEPESDFADLGCPSWDVYTESDLEASEAEQAIEEQWLDRLEAYAEGRGYLDEYGSDSD